MALKFTLIKICLAFVLISIQGCAVVFYKDLDDQSFTPNLNNDLGYLSYRVTDLPVVASDSGMAAIGDTFKKSQLFSDMELFYDDTIPNKGLYILAEPLYKAPSIAAMGFGYLSASTLTLLPAWSNHDGYKVRYTIYKDGELMKTVIYDRERFVALWIGLIPFSWINLFTSEEYDAFESITKEFLIDLPKILARHAK